MPLIQLETHKNFCQKIEDKDNWEREREREKEREKNPPTTEYVRERVKVIVVASYNSKQSLATKVKKKVDTKNSIK